MSFIIHEALRYAVDV